MSKRKKTSVAFQKHCNFSAEKLENVQNTVDHNTGPSLTDSFLAQVPFTLSKFSTGNAFSPKNAALLFNEIARSALKSHGQR
jgi:hypothetical protein